MKMTCSDDAVVLKKILEQDRVYDFLAGLNMEFDQVRVQILKREKLPPLNNVISMVQVKESRRTIILQSSPEEGLALASNSGRNRSLKQNQNGSSNRNQNGDSNDTSSYNNPNNLWCNTIKIGVENSMGSLQLRAKSGVIKGDIKRIKLI